MKKLIIFLSLKISILKARPHHGTQASFQAVKNLCYSEDPWNYNLVSQDKDIFSGGVVQMDDILNTIHSHPRNSMFMPATSRENPSETFWEKIAERLENLMKNKDQPDSRTEIKEVVKEITNNAKNHQRAYKLCMYMSPRLGFVTSGFNRYQDIVPHSFGHEVHVKKPLKN
ncbi:hypothetical protein DFH28DRAFT_186411 [Melampsora americana]|nr:hypothetical protein DFH28DRAFT_186411 [Melampsora americana]